MKYRIIFKLFIFAQIVNLPVHGQGLFSDLYDGFKNRLRGDSSQSASTSAAPARASSSSTHNSSTSSSSAESHSTSSSLGFHALQESSHTTLSITPQVSRSSTTSSSSGSHASQESSRTPSPDRPQVPTTSRTRASNRNTGITIREPTENARRNTSTDRTRLQEQVMRTRKTAQFKKMARLEHRLRLDMADNPNSYSNYVLRNRRNTQDTIRNHLQTRLSTQAQRINTRRSSRIANNRERILRGGNVPTPSRQRSTGRNGHNESQDQVVPVQQFQPQHTTNQQLSGHRRTRSEWNSHASSSSQPQPLPNKDIIVQHPPSKPGGPPVFSLAVEAPFEPDRKVNSLPVTTTLYRSFDDEGERPRSTVRMSFGKSDSSLITAHSSHRAISSIHDAIDLHKQVKSTINGFKQLYRSTRKPKPQPQPQQRMGYYHPYANARTHPTSHNTNSVAANEHIHEQNHPNLQYTSQHHFHEGNQMNHPTVIEHPSLNHQHPHYSLATEASRRSQRV